MQSDDYLRDARHWTAYPEDCVAHAIRIAELLFEEGREPWIGRVRHVEGDFHHRLTPRRFPETTWTTHYIACTARHAYDPIAGEPLDLDAYASRVFGKPLEVAVHVNVEETADLLRAGQLRQRFRVRRN